MKAQKRCSRTVRTADTIHVGWKTDPVRDDWETGLKTSVASRDGLAARGQRPRMAFLPARSDPGGGNSDGVPRHSDGPRSSARPAEGRRGKSPRPTAAPRDERPSKGPTSAERRSIPFLIASGLPALAHSERPAVAVPTPIGMTSAQPIELPLRSTIASRPGAPVRRRRADSSAS